MSAIEDAVSAGFGESFQIRLNAADMRRRY